MKRTVRAWVVMNNATSEPFQAEGILGITPTRTFALRGAKEMGGVYRAVPCVVTYDDGRKAKRAKKKKGGGK